MSPGSEVGERPSDLHLYAVQVRAVTREVQEEEKNVHPKTDSYLM